MAEIHRLTDAGPIIGADTVWSQIAGGCARSNDMVAGVAALYDEVITTWRHP